jgi:N-acetylmuramoyl-L-alanine amidase
VDIVNDFGVEYGKENVLYMPHHANAGKGEGFEIFTSPGDTPADPFAKLYATIFKRRFPDIKFRHGYTDGKMEADKEKPFYELRMTKPPTILPEWNFFDVRESWDYMDNKRNQHLYADMICEFMSEVLNLKM